jgi:hypothetical protein
MLSSASTANAQVLLPRATHWCGEHRRPARRRDRQSPLLSNARSRPCSSRSSGCRHRRRRCPTAQSRSQFYLQPRCCAVLRVRALGSSAAVLGDGSWTSGQPRLFITANLYVVSYVAPGGLSAAHHAAPYRPSGPQHLTPLASWQVLRRSTRLLVLQGKPPFRTETDTGLILVRLLFLEIERGLLLM